MKLNTNFTNLYGKLTSFIGILLIGLSFFLIYISVVKLIQVNLYKDQVAEIKVDTKKYKQHIAKLSMKRIHKPTKAELDILSSQIKKHAELVNSLRSSILPLMNKLEGLLPKTVHLTVLEHDIQSQQIKIVAISDDISGMSDFLTQLEKDSAFSSVLLKRQATVQFNKIEKIEFELSIKESPST
ncbi:hypothetical protein MNBD_GAMMA12-41 [hydrothermal vent metagenome]|uniref:Type IV pilus biogenesis protein PilN n=1 Tax=hydrothermal vent metagenome TaxID=652676 RepID=A0A3B0YXY5_9ZZZZ